MSELCDNCEAPSWTGETPIPAPAYPGGEGGDFDDLSNRPKYDGQSMSSETNIPKVVNNTFTGSTELADGTKGLVPAPEAGEEGMYLKGDGNWGNVDYAESASNIVTDSNQDTTSTFAYRTTAGTLSVENGTATLVSVLGNTIEETVISNNFEVKENNLTNNPSVTVVESSWLSKPWGESPGVYTFTTLVGGRVDVSDANGVSVGTAQGWNLNLTGVAMNPQSAAMQQAVGSSVKIEFTKGVATVLNIAKPYEFISTGYNQVPGSEGGKVIAGNLYRIDGDYTAIEVEPFDGSAAYSITPDVDNKFTPSKSGWINITGNGQFLVALVWSGDRDDYPWEQTWQFAISIPITDKNGNALPTASYGMPKVGDVADEIDYANRRYIQRIGRYPYSEANLAIVQEMGVEYIYDNTNILYVLESPSSRELSPVLGNVFKVDDYGTEWFISDSLGTPVTVPLTARIIYGSNLVDKLRNLADIQYVTGGLTLDDGTLSSSSIIELTANDYNYPENAPTTVALWLLKPGLYTRATGVSVNITTTSWLGSSEVAVVGKAGSFGQPIYVLYTSSTAADGFCFCDIYNVTWLGTSSTPVTLCAPVDALTSTSVNAPLSANQGKVLKGLVDSLVFKNAGAPTTATVGTVGQLLEDTTNGKLYICTAADTVTPAYTWVEVGAGGGGGSAFTTLTSADYNWPESGTKDSVALWKLDPGIYYVDNNSSLTTRVRVSASDTSAYYQESLFVVYKSPQNSGYVTIEAHGKFGTSDIGGILGYRQYSVWASNGTLTDSQSLATHSELIEAGIAKLSPWSPEWPESSPDGMAVFMHQAGQYDLRYKTKLYLTDTYAVDNFIGRIEIDQFENDNNVSVYGFRACDLNHGVIYLGQSQYDGTSEFLYTVSTTTVQTGSGNSSQNANNESPAVVEDPNAGGEPSPEDPGDNSEPGPEEAEAPEEG